MPAWFLIHRRGVVLRNAGGQVALPEDADVEALGVDVREAQSIGLLDGREALAAAVAEDAPMLPPLEVVDFFALRGHAAVLGADCFRLAGVANQLVDWAETHRFCGRCASRTVRVAEERAVRCPSCGLLGYPRISPAVIALVRRGDEALLAHGVRFPRPFYSTLAGFVEVGETLEEAVMREIREEVGIEVKNVRYFGSQPWPFPHSLMIAFMVEWAGGEIAIAANEIVDARWFRVDALPVIPPRLSIARRLIDAWIEDVDSKKGQYIG